jgi:hypothetical protein
MPCPASRPFSAVLETLIGEACDATKVITGVVSHWPRKFMRAGGDRTGVNFAYPWNVEFIGDGASSRAPA